MDSLTLELFRFLQSGPYDESGLKQIRTLLRSRRGALLEQGDQTALAEIVELLSGWAEASGDPTLASAALQEASEIARDDLQDPELANGLNYRAEEPTAASLNVPAIGAAADAALAERLAAAGDFDGAIEAYERALNVEANMDLVGKLAELYVQRGGSGDSHQAADLYCTLGDVLGDPDGLAMLELALGLDPDHAEARVLLTQYRGTEATEPGPSRKPVPPLQAARSRNAARASQLSAPGADADSLPLAASGTARSQASALVGQSPGAVVTAPSVGLPPSTAQSGRSSRTPASVTLAGGMHAAGITARNPAANASPPALRSPRAAPITLPGGAAAAAAVAPSAAAAAPRRSEPSVDPGRDSQTHPVGRASTPNARPSYPFASVARTSAPPATGRASAAPEKTRASVAPAQTGRASSAPPIARTSAAPASGRASSAPPRAAGSSVPPGAGRASAPPRPRVYTPLEPDRLDLPLAAAGGQDLVADGELPFPTSLSPVVRTDDAMTEPREVRSDRRWLIGTAIGASVTAAAAAFMIVTYTAKPASAPSAAARVDAPAPSAVAAERLQGPTSASPAVASAGNSETSVSLHPNGSAAQPASPTAAPAQVAAAAGKLDSADTEQRELARERAAEEREPERQQPKAEVRTLLEAANLRGGKLNEQQLTAAIGKATAKIERCYAQVLEDKPRTKGRLTVGWTIRPNGRAAAVKKISGTIKNADLTKCTLQAITNTRFPKPKKQAAQIKLPIDYRRP